MGRNHGERWGLVLVSYEQSIQKTSPVYETGDVFSGFKLRQQVLFSVFFVQKTTPVVLKKTHF